jgi:hypothetical protein
MNEGYIEAYIINDIENGIIERIQGRFDQSDCSFYEYKINLIGQIQQGRRFEKGTFTTFGLSNAKYEMEKLKIKRNETVRVFKIFNWEYYGIREVEGWLHNEAFIQNECGELHPDEYSLTLEGAISMIDKQKNERFEELKTQIEELEEEVKDLETPVKITRLPEVEK